MIHIGVIGLGNIAHRFCKSLSYVDDVELTMVASRSREKGEYFKKTYGALQWVDNYEELISSSQIDLVYIALPHGMHKKYIEKCVLENKACLCEKPFSTNYEDTKMLQELAQEHHVFCMEALKGVFVPGFKKLKQDLEGGVIGEILRIEANFESAVPYNEKHYLFSKTQGGALLDVGIYPLSFCLALINKPIKYVSSEMVLNQHVDVDDYTNMCLKFDNGPTCFLEVAIDRYRKRIARIVGTNGFIEIENYYRLNQYTIHKNGESKVVECPYEGDDMTDEINEVVSCLKNGKIESEVYPMSMTTHLALLMQEIKEKAEIFKHD